MTYEMKESGPGGTGLSNLRDDPHTQSQIVHVNLVPSSVHEHQLLCALECAMCFELVVKLYFSAPNGGKIR